MNAYDAEMSEWFKEHDWKSCDAGMYPEVQILFSAPSKKHPFAGVFCLVGFRFFEEDLRDELPVKQGIDNAL